MEIVPSTQAKHTNGRSIVSSGSLNNKQIVYEPDALRAMAQMLYSMIKGLDNYLLEH